MVVIVMILPLPRSVIAGARAAVVASTLGVANVVILETTVSYFGLGIQPPTASWGTMLSNSPLNMWTAPWIATVPGLMILLTLPSINFSGDGLRDALGPHLSSR